MRVSRPQSKPTTQPNAAKNFQSPGIASAREAGRNVASRFTKKKYNATVTSANPAPVKAFEAPKMGISFPSTRAPKGRPARKAKVYTLITRPRIASVAMSCARESIREADAIMAAPARKRSAHERGGDLDTAKPAVKIPSEIKINSVTRPRPFNFSMAATVNAPKIDPAPEDTSSSV